MSSGREGGRKERSRNEMEIKKWTEGRSYKAGEKDRESEREKDRESEREKERERERE